MQVCVIHKAEDLRIEDRATPDIPPGGALIRIRAGGICGSDLHYYFEGRNGDFVIREPFIPGHEVSGEVAAVAAGVTRLRPGQRGMVGDACIVGRHNDARVAGGRTAREIDRPVQQALPRDKPQRLHRQPRRSRARRNDDEEFQAMPARSVSCI